MHVVRPPITDRKLRFALVGCGRIAANHFDAVKAHALRCELTDVCDVDPAALRAAVECSGARGHGSLTALLANTDADCVVLTTPSGLHPAQVIEVARAGLDVMTEKPMATRWSDGLAMVRACDEAGVRLFVVKQNRRNRTLQLLKRAIEQRRFGRILNVTVVALPTLAVRNGTEIVGYCFTPQDGNSLLSSVSAATWLLYPDDYEQRVQCLKPYFYDEV